MTTPTIFYYNDQTTSQTLSTTITSNNISNTTNLVSVTIGNNVTTLGNYCFESCENLTSITISNSITTIGTGCFFLCSSLTQFEIPILVTTIPDECFYNCSSLSLVVFPQNNLVTSIGGDSFFGCSLLTSIDISDSVTSIGARSFYSCSSLTSINIPDLTHLNDEIFNGCMQLTSIDIPDSVTSIGDGCFYGCEGLTSITIPPNCISLGLSCLDNCLNLETVILPVSLTTIGSYCFSSCGNLTTLQINSQTQMTNASLIGTNIFNDVGQLTVDVYECDSTTNPTKSAGYLTLEIQFPQNSTVNYYTGSSCFNEGTRILCYNKILEKEEWRLIEDLRVGDLVKSYKHGIRPISYIGKNKSINSKGKIFNNLYKHKNFPNFIVTGGHSLLVDVDFYKKNPDLLEKNISLFGKLEKIDDKLLLLVASIPDIFDECPEGNTFTYYHFVLDTIEGDTYTEEEKNDLRFGVWASGDENNDGILTETPSKKQFLKHNYIPNN